MSLTGRISVDVQFTDTTSSSGVKSLKVLTLQDATEYPDGKAAIVSGTVGTAQATLWNPNDGGIAFGGYRDSSGQPVTFSNVSRIALRGSGVAGVAIEDQDLGQVEMISVGNQVSVGNHNGGQNITIRNLGGTAGGTAFFTAVLYGS